MQRQARVSGPRRLESGRSTDKGISRAVLALAAFFRLASLGAPALWGDEVLAAGAQYLPLGELLDELHNRESVRAPIDPPAYHLANRWFHAAIPDPAEAIFTPRGRFFLRLLSALAGVGLVGLVFLLARRLASPNGAWVPALLVAFSFYGIYYSQENRPYAAVAVVAALSAWLLLQIAATRDWRLAPAYGLSLALLGYLHYVAAMVIVVHVLALAAMMAIGRKKVDRGVYLIAGLGLSLAALLLAPWLFETLLIALKPQLFQPHIPAEGGTAIAGWRMLLAAGAHFGCGMWGSLIVFVPLAALGWLTTWRKNRLAALLFAAHYAVPTLYLAATGFGQFFHPRYLIFVYPIHQLLAGLGVIAVAKWSTRRLDFLRRRPWIATALLLLLLLALNAAALGEYYRYGIKCSTDAPAFADFCNTYIH